MKTRKATDYIYTHSGLALYPEDIKARHIEPLDIAIGLSRIKRYNGHTNISVLRHSLAVAKWAYASTKNYEVFRLALFHDAAEAYMMDVPKPLQRLVGDKWKSVYSKVEKAIFNRFKVKATSRLWADVKMFDNMVVQYEMNYGAITGESLMRYPLKPDLAMEVLANLDRMYRWDIDDDELVGVFLREVKPNSRLVNQDYLSKRTDA